MKLALGILLLLASLTGARPAAAQTPVPRIVNGTPTGEYPTAGALLFYADPQRTELDGLCSGVLIGCHTFVTAAHCICDEAAEDARDCERFGLVDQRTIEVYLPHAGFFGIERMAIHPEFVFAEGGDIAVLNLARTATGILPSAINTTARPPVGTTGTLVGFGTTGGRAFDEDDAGLKRQGPVTTTDCDGEVPESTHLCWRFSGVGASTCSGDSGGPLFVANAGGVVVAGTTSGGTRESCLAPDFSFDTDIFVHSSFIVSQVGDDVLGERCDDGPVVGDNEVNMHHWTGDIRVTAPEARMQFEVPAGATSLRVGLNGQFAGGDGRFRFPNQFNLYARAGAPPTRTEFDCAQERGSVFGYCELSNPAPGTWHILVDDVEGEGEWQVTATTFVGSVCIGDCDGDGRVTVDELVAAVTSALGNGAAVDCESLDINEDGKITVDEIVTAVDNALSGCAKSSNS